LRRFITQLKPHYRLLDQLGVLIIFALLLGRLLVMR